MRSGAGCENRGWTQIQQNPANPSGPEPREEHKKKKKFVFFWDFKLGLEPFPALYPQLPFLINPQFPNFETAQGSKISMIFWGGKNGAAEAKGSPGKVRMENVRDSQFFTVWVWEFLTQILLPTRKIGDFPGNNQWGKEIQRFLNSRESQIQ